MHLGQRLAELRARIAADQQQPPRHELAVIGHADRRRSAIVELFGGRDRVRPAGSGGRGEALIQRRQRIGVKLVAIVIRAY